MSTEAFYETPEWKMGDTAQRGWARIVARRGNIVLPTYGMVDTDAATKAPMLFANDGLLVAPDLLVMRIGKHSCWHEVKAKAEPSWFRKLQRWEHGFDYSLLREYASVQQRTGAPVLVVVHEPHAPVDPLRQSPVTGPEMWLWIYLDVILQDGEHRTDWPGGKTNPTRRGRRGMGGILWARSSMRTVVLTEYGKPSAGTKRTKPTDGMT